MEAVEIIAHRGASFLAPENTLASANLAWDEGADAVEGDFRLTRDGQLVAFHDENVRRTAGVDRRLDEYTLDQLQALDVGAWKDPSYCGERVATLAEMLNTTPAGKRFYVELKCGRECIEPLAAVLTESRLQPAQSVLICIDFATIVAIKRAIPIAPAYWVVDFRRDSAGAWQPTPDEMLRAASEAQLDGLDLRANGPIDAGLVQRIHAAQLRTCVWTVDDPAAARKLIDFGIQGITTNRPGWLRQQLAL